MDNKIQRQSSGSDIDQPVGEGEGVRVVAMCTFEAVQDYELGFRQYDVLTAIAKAEEDPSWWVGQIGGKIGLFPSECVEILKGYPDRLPLFKIFLNDDGSEGIECLMSNDDVPVQKDKYISPSASTASLVSSSSSTEVDTTPRQRASTHPEADVAIVSCYRCNTQVSIRKGQSFYPCECGANVKRPDDDDIEQQEAQHNNNNIINNRADSHVATRRRCNTAGAAVGGVVREEETPKQRKKREKREREQKKRQEEEDRKFRERRDKGRLSASQWNRQVDSARERLWRASVIMTGPNQGETSTNDDGSTSMLSTDDNLSTVGSSAFDVDTFDDSPRDFSSASSGVRGSLSRTGSLSSISFSSTISPESAKMKSDKKKKKTTKTKTTGTTMTKEQKKKEKEEKKRLKRLEKEEKEERRKMERTSKKRRGSLFGSSSGSIATRRQRDKLTGAPANGDREEVTVTINPITAHAKRQQQQMKAKTMVKTKSGKVMSLEEIEREGKKTNWDVSRLFSVRIIGGGGGRAYKPASQGQRQRKASVGAAAAAAESAQLAQRAAQQERELQEAARQLEEERRRFAEERQRFEEERLKVMIKLAQDMEGVKMAREGTPMYPSPANHPLLLVPTEPSPIPSFAASQSSFTCLPSAAGATLSADALGAGADHHHQQLLPSGSTTMSAMPSMPMTATATSNSTPSLPSVYNPSLTSVPTTTTAAADADVSDAVDVTEATEAVPSSPRKPPSGGVFLPFLVAPRGPAGQRNGASPAPATHQRESEAAAEIEEKLLDQLKHADDDDDEDDHDHKKEKAESETDSDEEEEELTDDDDEEEEEEDGLTSSEEEEEKEVRVRAQDMREKRKITVAPIQGIPAMKMEDLDARRQQRQQLEGSWVTAVSPRQRERDDRQRQQQQQQKAGVDNGEDGREMKDVIVRPGAATAADKPKKVSFGGTSWTSAESPRRMLEALRAQGASQAEIDRERRRWAAVAEAEANAAGAGNSELTAATAAIATKYEDEIGQLLEKMKQLRDRSSSDDSWGSSSDDVNENIDDKKKKQQQPHDISSDEDDDDDDEEDDDLEEEDDEAEVVIPEWTRGPPKSLKEMKEYKEFVRARYEAEKRATERMLRRNQREMRSRGMTVASSTPASGSAPAAAFNRDQRVSWVI